MKSLWKVRAPYFRRPGLYTIKLPDRIFAFVADNEGLFEVFGEPPSGLGIFANRIDGAKKTILIGGMSSVKPKP